MCWQLVNDFQRHGWYQLFPTHETSCKNDKRFASVFLISVRKLTPRAAEVMNPESGVAGQRHAEGERGVTRQTTGLHDHKKGTTLHPPINDIMTPYGKEAKTPQEEEIPPRL